MLKEIQEGERREVKHACLYWIQPQRESLITRYGRNFRGTNATQDAVRMIAKSGNLFNRQAFVGVDHEHVFAHRLRGSSVARAAQTCCGSSEGLGRKNADQLKRIGSHIWFDIVLAASSRRHGPRRRPRLTQPNSDGRNNAGAQDRRTDSHDAGGLAVLPRGSPFEGKLRRSC